LGRGKNDLRAHFKVGDQGLPLGPGRKLLEEFFALQATPVCSRGLLVMRDGKKHLRAHLKVAKVGGVESTLGTRKRKSLEHL